jgi:oxygen-independent coproporphyrinogen-3 oxidase
MQNLKSDIPVTLYVHLPWCVQKCPYCDFNSHALKNNLPEDLYVHALLDELHLQHHLLQQRPLTSIFFGGGTPSLFSGKAIGQILEGVSKLASFSPEIEITLEANPGTIDHAHFQDYRIAGVNRLSIGVQSLDDQKLKVLGRIHDTNQVHEAIATAKRVGFDNFNLDIMYGLPEQTLAQALSDIRIALAFEPTHFSWYQLTLEPNTLFYRAPPPLPHDDLLWEMQLAGQAEISSAGFQQYEVSAYSLPDKMCKHNVNYWEFGDYLGIGAGAHSKITNLATQQIFRYAQVKHPKDYLTPEKRRAFQAYPISEKDVVFEFMLNTLRLKKGVRVVDFTQRTGLSIQIIEPLLKIAKQKDWLIKDEYRMTTTELGERYLNDVVGLFL